MSSLLNLVPKPLYEDIVRGRWVPVIGSGLSRNAVVTEGNPPPDWNGLAEALKEDLTDAEEASDAVDVISSYAHEHGRPALIERVASLVRLADAEPADVHRSLCRLPIDTAITTNFDTLLEQAFIEVRKPCHAVIDESQLSLSNPFPGPTLLKVHGDLSHPKNMVLTEEDYDSFLVKSPLLATIMAAHFAQKSVVLIGYSLSDSDLRQILALVRDRLGNGARAIYSLEVAPTASKVQRFARRHVKVVPLPGVRNDPAEALKNLFDQLFDAIGDEAGSRLVPKTHEVGLTVAVPERRRSVFLSCAIESQADYFDWLAPVAERLGARLTSFQDFVAPGESISAAVDSMIAASIGAVVEVSTQWTAIELGTAMNRLGEQGVFPVTAQETRSVNFTYPISFHRKPTTALGWGHLAEAFEQWLALLLEQSGASSLTARNEIVGSVITTAGRLESLLGELLDLPAGQRGLGRLVQEARKRGLINTGYEATLREFVDVRNRLAHGQPIAKNTNSLRSLNGKVERIMREVSGIDRNQQDDSS